MDIIALKIQNAATMISTPAGSWKHEESWSSEELLRFHSIPASVARQALSGKPYKQPRHPTEPPSKSVACYNLARWMLISSDGAFLAQATLSGEFGTFTSFWLNIEAVPCRDRTLGTILPLQNSIPWLIEFIVHRLRPDFLLVQGAGTCLEKAPLKVIHFPHQPHVAVQKTTWQKVSLAEVTLEWWDQAEISQKPKQDMPWIKKTIERELQHLKSKSTRPPHWFIQLLKNFSPIRRQRHEKMIHPLTRYRYRPW
jgi:hypothetical protein